MSGEILQDTRHYGLQDTNKGQGPYVWEIQFMYEIDLEKIYDGNFPYDDLSCELQACISCR